MNTVIKLSRCETIAANRDNAIVYLDSHEFTKSEPVIVEYRKEDGTTDILFAIGTDNGRGRDCYSIVSIGEETVISGVTFDDPIDVSSVYNSQKYLSCHQNYIDEEGEWAIVTISDGQIKKVEKVEGDRIFRNLADGFRWFLSGNTLKREDDSYTKEEAEDAIKNHLYVAVPIKMNVEVGNTVFENSFTDPYFDILITDFSGKDITLDCKIEFTSNTRGKEEVLKIEPCIEGDHRFILNCKTIKTTTVYTITAEYKNTKVREKRTFYICAPVLYGTKNTTLYPALHSPISEDIEFEFNLSGFHGDCSVIAIPDGFGEVEHIFDVHGLDYLNDYTIEKKSGYTYYTKIDPVVIENFKQRIVFKK